MSAKQNMQAIKLPLATARPVQSSGPHSVQGVPFDDADRSERLRDGGARSLGSG
jgi:hypothetical protein